MTTEQKAQVLSKARDLWEVILKKHVANTEKLRRLNDFQWNPFTIKYLPNYAYGDASSRNIAKTLVYVRVLSQSINTSLGLHFQNFCNEVIKILTPSGGGSLISGIDIEFIDHIDHRKKYCQLKSGPNCINRDDIETIIDHFTEIKNRARINNVKSFNPSTDCVVGVIYGTNKILNSSYKKLEKEFPVYVGKELWQRLTGDEKFYDELIDVSAQVAINSDTTHIVEKAIESVAQDIEKNWSDLL